MTPAWADGSINGSADWRAHGYGFGMQYRDRYTGYRAEWRDRWSPWWNHGFYGGYYWEFHPFLDIDTYYYDPTITWFYVGDWDDYYYRTWYGADYDTYVELHRPCRYVGIIYPTEEFRDLNLGVSGMPVPVQLAYRNAFDTFYSRLEAILAARGGAALAQDSVVVDHYQTLPDDAGIVVEGFVSQDAQQFPFKALLDLGNPDSSLVFAPTSDTEAPSASADADLDNLNQRISDLGGVIEGEDQNTAPAPTEDGTATVPQAGSGQQFPGGPTTDSSDAGSN